LTVQTFFDLEVRTTIWPWWCSYYLAWCCNHQLWRSCKNGSWWLCGMIEKNGTNNPSCDLVAKR
jgi:hypothetical protein